MSTLEDVAEKRRQRILSRSTEPQVKSDYDCNFYL
jgi:hypothetical protein